MTITQTISSKGAEKLGTHQEIFHKPDHLEEPRKLAYELRISVFKLKSAINEKKSIINKILEPIFAEGETKFENSGLNQTSFNNLAYEIVKFKAIITPTLNKGLTQLDCYTMSGEVLKSHTQKLYTEIEILKNVLDKLEEVYDQITSNLDPTS